MKTDYHIQIDVAVGVSPELSALLHNLLGAGHSYTTTAPKEADVVAPEPGVTTTTDEAVAPLTVDLPEPEPVEEAPATYTTEDVRSAMHRCRQRIEGEDYKDNTDSEAYKKYHRQLTSRFKAEAALLGADKPSELPEDKRKAFIDAVDALSILDDGSIGVEMPF